MLRKTTSLTMLISLFALSSSGILMIILDSLSFQLQMHPVHKIFGILLTLSGLIHVYLNFGAIKKYLAIRKIVLYSLILTALMIFLYGVGISKPLDTKKVNDIERILKNKS